VALAQLAVGGRFDHHPPASGGRKRHRPAEGVRFIVRVGNHDEERGH
jgi:hypothetical protein